MKSLIRSLRRTEKGKRTPLNAHKSAFALVPCVPIIDSRKVEQVCVGSIFHCFARAISVGREASRPKEQFSENFLKKLVKLQVGT